MTRFWTFIVSLCLSCLAVARADNSLGVDSRTDSLLSVYDRMVDHAADYIALRQSSIDSLRQNHSPLTTLRLAELYVPYRSDSALHYYNLAIASDDEQVASRAAIRRIRLLASIGDFDAAFRERKKVQDVAPSNRVIYYDAMYRLYSEAAMSAKLQSYSDEYWTQAHAYADSLIAYCDANALRPSEYWRQRISQANSRRDFYTALACTDSALMSLTPEQHEYAIFAFERAVIYRDMGDIQTYYQWLIRSAITDVRCGVTDNGSSWMIAMEAYEKGNLERAYRYINYSISNATIFHATTRYQQIAPVALIISRTHEEQQVLFNVRLWVTVIGLIFVVLCVVIAVFVAYKRNRELSILNSQLSTLNNQLLESNMVKEQYICRYLEVYSDMIDRMARLARKTEKNPDAFLRKEMLAYYRDFDQTFLLLFFEWPSAFG